MYGIFCNPQKREDTKFTKFANINLWAKGLSSLK